MSSSVDIPTLIAILSLFVAVPPVIVSLCSFLRRPGTRSRQTAGRRVVLGVSDSDQDLEATRPAVAHAQTFPRHQQPTVASVDGVQPLRRSRSEPSSALEQGAEQHEDAALPSPAPLPRVHLRPAPRADHQPTQS